MPPKKQAKKKRFDSYLSICDADLMICGLLCKHEIPCHSHPTSQFQTHPVSVWKDLGDGVNRTHLLDADGQLKTWATWCDVL